jgi:hypothetical protein
MKAIQVEIGHTLVGALESVPFGLVVLQVKGGKSEPFPLGLVCQAAAVELRQLEKLLEEAKGKLKALEQQAIAV